MYVCMEYNEGLSSVLIDSVSLLRDYEVLITGTKVGCMMFTYCKDNMGYS